jgi:hypothetical protein
VLPSTVAGKSPPDRITISGPTLASSVEIVDALALSEFSPWARAFIDWDRGISAGPPEETRRFEVSFYLDERDPAPVYVLHYAPVASGPGYIYIPGRGEPWHQSNIGTIQGASTSDRWAPEGKWQYATGAWDALIRTALERSSAAPQPAHTGGDQPMGWVVLAASSVTGAMLLAALRLRAPAAN